MKPLSRKADHLPKINWSIEFFMFKDWKLLVGEMFNQYKDSFLGGQRIVREFYFCLGSYEKA